MFLCSLYAKPRCKIVTFSLILAAILVFKLWVGKTQNITWHGADMESAFPNCVRTTVCQILLENALPSQKFRKWALTMIFSQIRVWKGGIMIPTLWISYSHRRMPSCENKCFYEINPKIRCCHEAGSSPLSCQETRPDVDSMPAQRQRR